jgi:hypothetical protein
MPARNTHAGQHFGYWPKNSNPYALLTSSVTARLGFSDFRAQQPMDELAKTTVRFP